MPWTAGYSSNTTAETGPAIVGGLADSHGVRRLPSRPMAVVGNGVILPGMLEWFCRPGRAVCDPVMLDRAGTALAARRLGCTFVGASKLQPCIEGI